MATTYTVKDNQSMLNVALQATGSHEAAMRMCRDNNVSLMSVPAPGTVMIVSDAALALGDAGVRRTYATDNVIVANADVQYVAGGLLTDDGDQLNSDDGTGIIID